MSRARFTGRTLRVSAGGAFYDRGEFPFEVEVTHPRAAKPELYRPAREVEELKAANDGLRGQIAALGEDCDEVYELSGGRIEAIVLNGRRFVPEQGGAPAVDQAGREG